MVVAVACVAAGAVACARSGGGDPGPGGSEGTRVDAALVHFEVTTGVRADVRTVLRSRADVTAFAGWAPVHDLEAELDGRDFRSEALIAFIWNTSCARGRSADLTHAPGTGYSARLLDVSDHMECYAPYTTVAVFALPRSRVPRDVRVGGAPPGPPGPAEQVAFSRLERAVRPRAAEVTQPDQFRAFDEGLPGGGLEGGAGTGAGSRLFAYVVTGCRNTAAVLRITAETMTPVPVGGEGARCVAPESYAVVFEIPAANVPRTATIG
ncbi:hypothetical protein SRB5_08910 [Streptomyces sp. RB5]|uniref:Uncharacterized protein n=1 Tax=Streptomyces smaragdinus TaxID=2585196 RepID=A0A7K0CBI1_9ACTN|nr:hypothetical protein [Streptomyces smaragdinus]MQY10778.1 hypothetical protein [Streptomyces smaragdinus]